MNEEKNRYGAEDASGKKKDRNIMTTTKRGGNSSQDQIPGTGPESQRVTSIPGKPRQLGERFGIFYHTAETNSTKECFTGNAGGVWGVSRGRIGNRESCNLAAEFTVM